MGLCSALGEVDKCHDGIFQRAAKRPGCQSLERRHVNIPRLNRPTAANARLEGSGTVNARLEGSLIVNVGLDSCESAIQLPLTKISKAAPVIGVVSNGGRPIGGTSNGGAITGGTSKGGVIVGGVSNGGRSIGGTLKGGIGSAVLVETAIKGEANKTPTNKHLCIPMISRLSSNFPRNVLASAANGSDNTNEKFCPVDISRRTVRNHVKILSPGR